MFQPVAVPVGSQVSFDAPAWRKAAGRREDRSEQAPGLVSWLGAAALTGLLTAVVLAALAAEYAALWAVLVAPWLDSLPATFPWAW